MIVQVVSVWVVLCLSVQLGAKAELKFENNAYSNVLVSFSPNVPSENGQFLLESMQDLLENASQILQGAYKVRIAEVVFLLPHSWNTATWGLALEPKSIEESTTNIVVDATTDSAFGKHPFTLQFGGCGVPGKHITVPTTFLSTSIDYPKGTLFAREWIKYRYGVFDENGYPGDKMYPDQYFIPGNDEDVKITECTDPPVEYIFRDSNGNNCSLTKNSKADNNDCRIYPGEASAENVKSSLMYFREDLPNMVHFCGIDHSHNNLSPNKHNILCAEKDIWSVVKDSEDFKSAGVETAEYSNVVFRYIQESKPRVSVLLENTIALFDKKTPLVFAVTRFLYDLSEGSSASVYSFTDAQKEVTKVRPLSPLPAVSDRNIIIRSSFDFENEEVCPTCALDMTIAELTADGVNEPGFIIMIIGSNAAIADTTVEKLKASKLCVTVIAFKEAESAIEGYESLLSASTCNSLIEISTEEEEVPTFERLYQALETTIPHPPEDYVTSTVTSGMMSFESIIEIPAKTTAEKFTLWIEQNIGDSSIVCTRDDGANLPLIKVIESMAYSFYSENKAVTCKLKNQKLGATLAQVQMTTIRGEYFAEDVWIHDPTRGDQQMPVIIYVKINFAHNPVSNAKVTANVTDPDGNMIGEPLILYDNGKGDPDITRNDGIYSRYFFEFSKEGNYEVTVEIDDGSGMARVLENGADHCCGSEVKALKQKEVGPFKKTLYSSFHAKSGQPENGYPPMRIIDLSVEEFQPPTSLVLKWTAPGGEVDSGKASSYEFKLFCDSEEICKGSSTLPVWIMFNNSKPIPKEHGETEVAQLVFSSEAPKNLTLLIGIETINIIHTSGLSNRVQVRVPPLDEILEASTLAPEKVKKELKYSSTGTIVGLVVAGIFILICLACLVYFLVTRMRMAKHDTLEPRIEASHGVEKSNSFKAVDHIRAGRNSMRRVESFPVLLYTHDQIKDVKGRNKNKEPSLFKANAAPKPWLSLGELPSSHAKTDDDKSEDSACTMSMNDKIGSNEIKQLDDTSSSSDMQADKIAKF